MLQKLIRIVEDAGEMIRCAHHIEEDITEKSSPIDVVTKYDTAVQEHLHRELLKLMPEAGFLGEEGAHEEITTEWTFIVDPIDGTANFVRNFDHSNISVALARNGVTEYGVVYNPYRGELYAAQRGKGATLNGKPIHVSDSDAAHGLLLCGSTAYDRELTDRHFAIMRRLYDCMGDYRRLGAAALDLCYIAAGRGEVFFECRLRPWDFAAAMLVVTEAGGQITQMDGTPLDVLHNCSVFASNGACRGLIEEVKPYLA